MKVWEYERYGGMAEEAVSPIPPYFHTPILELRASVSP